MVWFTRLEPADQIALLQNPTDLLPDTVLARITQLANEPGIAHTQWVKVGGNGEWQLAPYAVEQLFEIRAQYGHWWNSLTDEQHDRIITARQNSPDDKFVDDPMPQDPDLDIIGGNFADIRHEVLRAYVDMQIIDMQATF